jgi:hypothetical protein
MSNTSFQKERVAALFGLDVSELPSGWEAFVDQPTVPAKKDKWLEDFLNNAPNLKAAFEKGTISVERSEDGGISFRRTPDYYLDLARMKVGKDLSDPLNKDAKPLYVEDLYPGFNPKAGNDDPENRKWACKMAVDAEGRRQAILKQEEFKPSGKLYSGVTHPQLRA